MRPDVFEVIGYGSLALLAANLGFFIWRMRKASKPQASFAKAGDALTAALQENSELLRELILINRKLLDKQDRPDP